MPCNSQRATFPQHLAHRRIPRRSAAPLCGAKYSYLALLIYDYPVVTCSPVKILGLLVKLIHEQKKIHSKLKRAEEIMNIASTMALIGFWLLAKAFDSNS